MRALELSVVCGSAYCEYDFLGETFTTETVECMNNHPQFRYEYTHHIDCVTPEIIASLSQPLRVMIHVSPVIQTTKSLPISSENPDVRANFGSFVNLQTPLGSPRSPRGTLASPPGCPMCETLRLENEVLRKQLTELKLKLAAYGEQVSSVARTKIEAAIVTDAIVSPHRSGDGESG